MSNRCAPIALAFLALSAGAVESSEVAAFPCDAESVILRVSDPEPKQGSVLVVEVRGETPFTSAEGIVGGEEVLHFWNDAEARVYQALLGIDFLKKPGPVRLCVRAVPEAASPVECQADLHVVDGAFPRIGRCISRD